MLITTTKKKEIERDPDLYSFLPQIARSPNKIHVVHCSNPVNENAMSELMIVRYDCCSHRGPFQNIETNPTTAKFHSANTKVM